MIIQDYHPDFHFATDDVATEEHPLNFCKVPTEEDEPVLLKTAVVFIDPDCALKMLKGNCPNNRAINKNQVLRLAADMKKGKFTVSDSAICFDSNGFVTNGQHRLNAIVEADAGQWCLIMINTDKEQGLRFDLGISRSMSDRITFNGVRITKKECAAVRHAMSDISKPTIGTTQYGLPSHDFIVEQHFLKFKDYFDFIRSAKDSTHAKSILSGCALKIWAYMKNRPYASYNHEMDVEERILHWLQITHNGAPKTNVLDLRYDAAAFQIYKHVEKLKQSNLYFNDFNALRMATNAAYKFMLGDASRVNNEHRLVKSNPFVRDPFPRLQALNATNPEYGEF